MTRARLTPRRRPTTERGQLTVAAILTAAAQLLPRLGRRKMTTAALAERAGVGIGTFYEYFPGRDSALVALSEDQLEAVESAFGQKLLAGSTPAQALVAAWFEAFEDDAALQGALAELARAPKIDVRVAHTVDRWAARLADVAGCPEEGARLALVVVRDALTWSSVHPAALLEDRAWRARLVRVASAALDPA